jgi:beta-xylosidase/AraC-like DNA-binding protein
MSDERKIVRLFTISKDESQTHYHQQIELFYLLGGSVDIRIDDQTYSMQADDFMIINANKTHSFLNPKDIVAARFEIDYNMLAEMLGTTQLFFWCNTVVDRNEAYDRCRVLMDKILMENYERESVNELQLHAYYFQLLAVLTGNFLISQNEGVSGNSDTRDSDRMQMIQNYIQANYQSQVSLNDLAKKLYLSNAYLSKYIKRNFGVTFVEYLNRVRMFHAVDELMYTDKNLTHIALDNGFPTSASFNRVFKEVYHVTPSEYRRKSQQDMNTASDEGDDTGRNADEIRSILREKEHLNPSTEGVVETRINASAYKEKENWTGRGINIRDSNLLLRSEVQNELLDIKRECGLEYVRVRFTSEMNRIPVREDILDHHSVNLMMDFLTNNGIKPVIVIGFTKDFTVRSQKNSSDNYRRFILDLWEERSQKIRDTVLSMVNRYGIEEVERWNVEFTVWPNTDSAEIAETFISCFAGFYRNIRKLLHNIRVGIGGFVLGYDRDRISTILTMMGKEGIKPDFISFNSFQKISFVEIADNYIGSSTDGNYLFNQMQLIRKVIDGTGCKVDNIQIGEWNHTTSRYNAFNDSCEQASYILKNCIAMKGHVNNMAYWHAVDSHDESLESGIILNGDSGIISRDGVRKPAFYAMSFYNKLMPYELQRDEHGIVTTNGRDHFVIACHNFKTMTYANSRIPEDEIKPENLANYLGNNEYLRLKYCLENVPNGQYFIKSYYVNQSNGSVLDMWKRMGFCRDLAAEEIEYLRKSSHPYMEISNIEVSSNVLELESELQPQEIRLMDIQFRYK